MTFNKKEKLSISALLIILYLIPAGLEADGALENRKKVTEPIQLYSSV